MPDARCQLSVNSKFKIQNSKFLFVFSLLAPGSWLLAPAYSQELPHGINIEEARLREGVLVMVEGKEVWIQNSGKKAGEKLYLLPPDAPVPLVITVLPTKPVDGQNILLPVEIDDVELAKGAQIQIDTREGPKLISIPRRKILIPQKFTLVFPGLGEPGRYGGKDGALILEVHARVSHRFDVDIHDTGDEGLVVAIGYEDLMQARFIDVQDRLDRRDLNLVLNLKTNREEKWIISGDNLFEAQSPRKIDLTRFEELGKGYFVQFRAEDVTTAEEPKFGTNLIYKRRNKVFEFGNVDRRVFDEAHFQARIEQSSSNLVLRMEEFRLRETEDFKVKGLLVKKMGAQLNLKTLPFGLSGSMGNLHLESVAGDLDVGRVDDELNFMVLYSREFGESFPRYTKKKVTFGLETQLRLLGIGDDKWLRQSLVGNLGLGADTMIQLRTNDDFLRLGGDPPRAVYQNRILTWLRYKKIMNDNSFFTGKLNLAYLFAEARWQRDDYSTPFAKTLRAAYGFGYDLMMLGYAIPLEVFGENSRDGFERAGLKISLRDFL